MYIVLEKEKNKTHFVEHKYTLTMVLSNYGSFGQQ